MADEIKLTEDQIRYILEESNLELNKLYIDFELLKRKILRGTIPRFSILREDQEEMEIEIKPLTKPDSKYVLSGLGMKHETEDLYGDLIVHIKMINSDPWGFNSNDILTYNLEINLPEFLLGFCKQILHLNGSYVTLYHHGIYNNKDPVIVKNKGYSDNEPLIIIIKTNFKQLNDNEIKTLSKIFNYNVTYPPASSINTYDIKKLDKNTQPQNQHSFGQRIGFTIGNGFGNGFSNVFGQGFTSAFGQGFNSSEHGDMDSGNENEVHFSEASQGIDPNSFFSQFFTKMF